MSIPGTLAMLLSSDHVTSIFDGTMTTPQLDHAEGLTFDQDGQLYCGGERGQIYRLSLDNRRFQQVGSTGGFCLGKGICTYRTVTNTRTRAPVFFDSIRTAPAACGAESR